MNIHSKKENIKATIELHRKELIETGLKHGFNSSETLMVSQKLDNLIIKYQKCKNNGFLNL